MYLYLLWSPLPPQVDMALPGLPLLRYLADTPRTAAWWAATTAAVRDTAAARRGVAPHVLLLGVRGGLLALAALRAGAGHVTLVDT
jgi:hypothetical protein